MIPRIQQADFTLKVAENKLVFLQGPRKIGKRTLIENSFQSKEFDFFDCSQKKVRKEIEENSLVSTAPFIVLYEAQYLSNLNDKSSDSLKPKLCCLFAPNLYVGTTL